MLLLVRLLFLVAYAATGATGDQLADLDRSMCAVIRADLETRIGPRLD